MTQILWWPACAKEGSTLHPGNAPAGGRDPGACFFSTRSWLVYVSRKNAAYKKTYMLAQDIDPNKLWLLEEGHCFRSQIVRLLRAGKASREGSHFDYEGGQPGDPPAHGRTERRHHDPARAGLPRISSRRQLELVRHFKRPAPNAGGKPCRTP